MIGCRKTAAAQRQLAATRFLGGQKQLDAFHDVAMATLKDELQRTLAMMGKQLTEQFHWWVS